MGIPKVSEVQDAAYCSSVIAWMQSTVFAQYCRKVDPAISLAPSGLEKIVQETHPSWLAFTRCLDGFNLAVPSIQDPAHAEPLETLVQLTTPVEKLQHLIKYKPKKDHMKETLQSYISDFVQKERVTAIETAMVNGVDHLDLADLKWWVSQKNEMSGQPLLAFPSMEPYVIRSSEFRTWLRYRYRISMGHQGLVCTCRGFPLVDDHGIHFTSGCNIDNLRTAIHDAGVLELESVIRYCGLSVAHEERHKFQTHLVDSNNRTDTTIKRSEVLDLGKTFNEVIIDHSIVS
jgi:hypothetical protein